MYKKFGQFYDGKWNTSSNKKNFEVINPSNEDILGFVPDASNNDIEKILNSAEKGFNIWKNFQPWKRAELIRKAANLIRENKDIIAKFISLEVGKPFKESLIEVEASADIFEWNAEETKRILGKIIESRFVDTRVNVYYQPVGVVFALIPWNFPCTLASRKIATALAAGCSIICKPSILAPGSVMCLFDIIKDAGFPEGVINLVSGEAKRVSEQFINSEIIKKISITGSTSVGKDILKLAAEKVQRVTMELGGHAPFIVYDDADIDKAVEIALITKYRNNGQVCTSPNRFFIHEKVLDKFKSLFVERTKKLKIGDPFTDVDIGPICSKRRLNAVEKLVNVTLEEGGVLLCGGNKPAKFNKGFYFEPTIFENIKDNFTIMSEEAFAPVSPILTFKYFEEVIERANNNENGLSAYVCTSSMEKAHKTADALETGMVSINTPVVSLAEIPFGGIKQSGYGREGGTDAIKDYLNTKYMHIGLYG